MEELIRCRDIGRASWKLIVRQPGLALLPLCSAIPTLIGLLLVELALCRKSGFAALLLIAAVPLLLQVFVRIAFSSAIFAALRGQTWSPVSMLRSALGQRRSAFIFGLIDAAASGLCALILLYLIFGALATGIWWCIAALVPSVLASEAAGLDRAIVQSERIFSRLRIELLLPAMTLSLSVTLVTELLMHLGLPIRIGAALFYILFVIPAREFAWQLFVSVAYFRLELIR